MRGISAALLALIASGATAETITAARYTEPTTRYDHGVLGDAVEWGALALTLSDGRRLTMRLPEALVFEDIAPRLADIDGDGLVEVITVEASQTDGARLAIYDAKGRRAATPYIGQRHRWLAPIGAADLDGDGRVEIAYIDRPHLAKTLRIWRLQEGRLVEFASQTGLTNHKIGWDFIAGGLRDCGRGPEMILASGDWQQMVAIQYRDGVLARRTIGLDPTPDRLDQALRCP